MVHILLFASSELGGLGEESNPISSRGPAEQAGKLTDVESKGELEKDDATVPRGPTEQAGKLLDIVKYAKSQEEEERRREYTAGQSAGEIHDANWSHLEVQPNKPAR